MTEFSFGSELLLASNNQGKIIELEKRLAPYGITLKTASEIDIPAPEETGDDFLSNALIKAKAYCEASGLPTLADDSGIVIPALGGYPGIHSGRVAEEVGGFETFFGVLEEKLKGVENPDVTVVCTLVFMKPDGTYQSFEGKVEANLVFPPRGEGGFGYDAILQPKGHDKTFAEDKALKARLSHRTRALEDFIKTCIE